MVNIVTLLIWGRKMYRAAWLANMTMKTILRPILSESDAQKRRPRPLKIEAMARMVPPAMARSAALMPGVAFLTTSWARGESWEMRPRPAETFRNSMPQSIHHWGRLTASSKVKESAADTELAGAVQPAGVQPLGGFL